MAKVVVNGKYTYEVAFSVAVGDKVLLPPARGTKPWSGVVTGLTSTYTGPCKQIISVISQ